MVSRLAWQKQQSQLTRVRSQHQNHTIRLPRNQAVVVEAQAAVAQSGTRLVHAVTAVVAALEETVSGKNSMERHGRLERRQRLTFK